MKDSGTEKGGGQAGFLQELLASLAGRSRRLFSASASGPASDDDLSALCEALLSSRGEASGVALAERILSAYRERDGDGRVRFFNLLASQFGIHAEEAVAAAEHYRAEPGAETMQRLQTAVEPRRQELLRRLNRAPGGTAALVAMRADLLAALAEPGLREVDLDFAHLFQSWFNRGFLDVRRIDWNTPAAVLDKIIHYEAVHHISDWDDLRRRIDPEDRRLYAFFHPSLPSEPLIFLEVALMMEMPASIDEILGADRDVVPAAKAKAAVFYSISNTQDGLRGVSFGNFLIKQVLEDLRREFRNLKTFATLSPLPGFARWLEPTEAADDLDADARAAIAAASQTSLPDAATQARLRPVLAHLAVEYLTTARNGAGMPLDPVARFHLGNGARLERINWPGDLSPGSIASALGVMVNYLYRPEEIERNHETFTNACTIAVSPEVARLMRPVRHGVAS